MIIPEHFFIFDVESIGLHGEGFAVAGGVLSIGQMEPFGGFCFSCPRGSAKGMDSDRKWVDENILPIPAHYETPVEIRTAFWNQWEASKQLFPGIVMAAECLWPVEAHFVIACVADDPSRTWDGPYPFHEIASLMAAAGMDPMAKYDRLEDEMPVHNPMADVRLSARLLSEALAKLKP